MRAPLTSLAAAAALAACSERVEPMGAMAFMPEAPTAADKMADEHGAPPGLERTMVAGWPMSADRDIVANLESAPQHRMFVAALVAANLDGYLSNAGAYTVFAPADSAFAALEPPPDEATLAALAGTHVVPGRLTAFELSQRLQMGAVRLTAFNGAPLTLTAGPEGLRIADGRGRQARIVNADGLQSNGIVHVIDAVLGAG